MGKFDFKRLDESVRKSALQRKEENQIFYSTHLQDLTNGEIILEEAFGEDSPEAESGFFSLERNSYKFAKFSDLIFGCDTSEDQKEVVCVTGVCFYYCDFSMCGFNNISFEQCAFVGCNFSECYTLGFTAIFSECRFMNRVKGESNIDDAPSMFLNCELSAKFIDSDLSTAVFEKSHFYFSRFERVYLKDTIFLDSSFDTVNICDCDLRNSKILHPKFIEFNIEDTLQRSKVNKNTILGKINYNKKEPREVRFAAEVYSQFSELFENGKLMDLSGEYFYLYKVTERLMLKGFSKFKSVIGWLICGYGERPFFSLIASLALVLTCGTLYMFFGVSINNEVIAFQPSLQQPFPPFQQLVTWYHFSLVTFSTTGYGNVVPVGGSIFVSALEMVMGVIMVGIWVSTLVRKMVR